MCVYIYGCNWLNLYVFMDVMVLCVGFDGKCVVGVVVLCNGWVEMFGVCVEVILLVGVFNLL